MKHKAPCSNRGYSGLQESGPLNIDGGGDGGVGEYDGGIAVDRRHTMMSRAAFRRRWERGGESPLLLLLP